MSDSSKALAYVSLGSNLGDRAGNLLLGIRGMHGGGFTRYAPLEHLRK